MISLIKNEFTKSFKKKSTIVMIIISLVFIVFNNVIYKFANNIDIEDYMYDEQYIQDKRQELKNLKPSSEEGWEYYIETKSEVEHYDLLKKYDKNDWKYHVVKNDSYEMIRNMNQYKYINRDEEVYTKELQKYNSYIEKINNMTDWKVYAKEQIKELQEQKDLYKEIFKDENEKKELELQNEIIDLKIGKLNLRLEKDIPYSNDYVNDALESYDLNFPTFEKFDKEQKETLKENYDSYTVKSEDAELAKSNVTNKYIIDTKIDINNVSTLRMGLINFFSDNSMLILVITISIAGAMVSSEFDKGTIKTLLIRPYSRNKILLSKFITALVTLAFSIILLLVFEFITAGIIFGFDSLKIPALVYNFTTQKVMEIGIFKYVIDSILANIPRFILLTTLAFTVSTIFNNTPLGIILPIVGYIGGSIINLVIIEFKLKFLNYFVTQHWDLTSYLYGNIGPYENSNVVISIIICIVYFAIMIIPTFIIFNKKNIKNI